MHGDLRQRRAIRVYSTALVLGLALFLFLLIALRSLILPCVIGALLAYICRPLLRRLTRWGLPRPVATVLLVATVVFVLFVAVNQIRSTIPDDNGKLELRVRTQYKLNQRYSMVMGLDREDAGNFLYGLVGNELNPMLQQIIGVISLTEPEGQIFLQHTAQLTDVDRGQRLLSYFRENQRRTQAAQLTAKKAGTDHQQLKPTTGSSQIAAVLGLLSLWLLAPFVFLFLLLDNGGIKKWLIHFVPNRYFEMTLTMVDSVDRAIGRYLRGTLLECGLVGFTIFVGLSLFGVEPQWAIVIGLLAGLSNAIPFLGPVIGLVIGLGYALIVEDVDPILPIFTADNLFIGVVLTVVFAQLLDNMVFQPVVLGGVVNLHPLVVIIGVMGGSILFGFAGMLFAVPTIVIVRVVVATLFQQLKAYRMI